MRGRPPIPIGVKAQQGDTRKLGARKFEESIASAREAQRGIPPTLAGSFTLPPKEAEAAREIVRLAKAHRAYLAEQLLLEKMLAECDGGMLDLEAYCYALAVQCGRRGDSLEFARLYQRYMQGADRMGLSESARARLPLAAGATKSAEDTMFDELAG